MQVTLIFRTALVCEHPKQIKLRHYSTINTIALALCH